MTWRTSCKVFKMKRVRPTAGTVDFKEKLKGWHEPVSFEVKVNPPLLGNWWTQPKTPLKALDLGLCTCAVAELVLSRSRSPVWLDSGPEASTRRPRWSSKGCSYRKHRRVTMCLWIFLGVWKKEIMGEDETEKSAILHFLGNIECNQLHQCTAVAMARMCEVCFGVHGTGVLKRAGVQLSWLNMCSISELDTSRKPLGAPCCRIIRKIE